ncbi:hypothetical protein [Bacillus smithii]|nr:hypothetical protein [Bacillus smithii]
MKQSIKRIIDQFPRLKSLLQEGNEAPSSLSEVEKTILQLA